MNHNRFLGYTKDENGNLVIVAEEGEGEEISLLSETVLVTVGRTLEGVLLTSATWGFRRRKVPSFLAVRGFSQSSFHTI